MNTFAVCTCVNVCVFVCQPIFHTVADTECWRYFCTFFPQDFLMLTFITWAALQFITPFFLSIIQKGGNLPKCESLPFIWLRFPPLSEILIRLFVLWQLQVRDSSGACVGERGVMWSLAGGFKEFGTSASHGWYCLNRPKSPLSFHAVLVTGCSNHRSGTHDSWRWW